MHIRGWSHLSRCLGQWHFCFRLYSTLFPQRVYMFSGSRMSDHAVSEHRSRHSGVKTTEQLPPPRVAVIRRGVAFRMGKIGWSQPLALLGAKTEQCTSSIVFIVRLTITQTNTADYSGQLTPGCI